MYQLLTFNIKHFQENFCNNRYNFEEVSEGGFIRVKFQWSFSVEWLPCHTHCSVWAWLVPVT